MVHQLAAAVVLLLAGCASYLKLDPKNVKSIEVTSGEGRKKQRICARGGLVDVAVYTKDGKKHYEGSSAKISEKEFDPKLVKLTANIGSFNERSWNPPNEANAMLNRTLEVTATLKANKKVTTTVELEPHWACDPGVAIVGGGDGESGPPNYGDYGADNERAPDGVVGGTGGNAGHVEIQVGYIPHDDGKLVAVYIIATGLGEYLYLLDPSIKLRVYAGGGTGGSGGGGFHGGASTADRGRGPNGGRGGDGGDGGDGGEVVVFYDAASPELAEYVEVDISGGAGGVGGAGGAGGTPGTGGDFGDEGGPGREGRPGRNGAVRSVAQPGIDSMLARFTEGHEEKPKRVAVAEPPDDGKGKKGKKGKKGGPPPPPEPPREPTGPKRKEYSSNDGARVYVGQAVLEMKAPGRQKPENQKGRVEVISTRTRKHHFTIKLGDDCTLAFHRPAGEKRHIYDLDEPITCDGGSVEMTIKNAQLELPTDTTLELSWGGFVATKCIKTPCKRKKVTLSYELAANRRM